MSSDNFVQIKFKKIKLIESNVKYTGIGSERKKALQILLSGILFLNLTGSREDKDDHFGAGYWTTIEGSSLLSSNSYFEYYSKKLFFAFEINCASRSVRCRNFATKYVLKLQTQVIPLQVKTIWGNVYWKINYFEASKHK